MGEYEEKPQCPLHLSSYGSRFHCRSCSFVLFDFGNRGNLRPVQFFKSYNSKSSIMYSLWDSDQTNRTNYDESVEIEDESVNSIEILQMKIEENDEILREIERFKRYIQHDDEYDEYDRIECFLHKIGIPFDIEETISITNHNVTKFQNIAESDIHIYSEDELWVLQVIS